MTALLDTLTAAQAGALPPVRWEDHCGNPLARTGGLAPCTLHYEPGSAPGGYLPGDDPFAPAMTIHAIAGALDECFERETSQ